MKLVQNFLVIIPMIAPRRKVFVQHKRRILGAGCLDFYRGFLTNRYPSKSCPSQGCYLARDYVPSSDLTMRIAEGGHFSNRFLEFLSLEYCCGENEKERLF